MAIPKPAETASVETSVSPDVKAPIDSKASTIPSSDSPVASTPVGEKKEMSPLIWLLLGILIVILLAVLVYFIGGQDLRNQIMVLLGRDVDVVDEEDSDETEAAITVTSPSEGDTVDGSILIKGTKNEEVVQVEPKVFTSDDVEVKAERSASEDNGFELLVSLMESPSTSEGYILVFPSEEGETSDLAVKVNVKFDNLTTGSVGGQERLKVTSPIPNQLISNGSGDLLVEGEMKDFFEAHLNFRLLDKNGKELYEGFITASEDNYGQFADFSKVVKAAEIKLGKGASGEGKLIFFDVSAKDGSETTVLELPIMLNTDLQE